MDIFGENLDTLEIIDNVEKSLKGSLHKLLCLEKKALKELADGKRYKENHNLKENKYFSETCKQLEDHKSSLRTLDSHLNRCELVEIPSSCRTTEFSNVSYLKKQQKIVCKREPEDDEDPFHERCSKIQKLDSGLITVKKEIDNMETTAVEQIAPVFNSKTAALVLESLASKAFNLKGGVLNCLGVHDDSGINFPPKCDSSKDPFLNRTISTSISPDEARLEKSYKAVIRFKNSFSYDYAKELLNKAGISNIKELVINKCRAVVSFLSEEQLQEFLSLNNQNGLNKLKAVSIVVLRPFILEESV